MDEIDKKIIKILLKNSRTPFTEIAKELNLSEATIRKRIKKLEEKGIIKGYSLIIDYKKSQKYGAIIGIDTTPEDFLSILNYLKELKEKGNNITEIYASTGDHMIMLKIHCESKEKLEEFIKNLNKKKGITKVCPSYLLEFI